MGEEFVGWTVHCRQGKREGETFNRNGGGLEGFGRDRWKLVVGDWLTNKYRSASVC